jgi:hypothetical protein
MYTKDITLQSGKTITLAPADLYQLVTTDIDIPNQAFLDITDLVNYGEMIDVDLENRVESNKRLIRSQYEIARLCCQNPILVLSGDVPEGALTARDLTRRDLNQIFEFFRAGGDEGVPVTTDQESSTGTLSDSIRTAAG